MPNRKKRRGRHIRRARRPRIPGTLLAALAVAALFYFAAPMLPAAPEVPETPAVSDHVTLPEDGDEQSVPVADEPSDVVPAQALLAESAPPEGLPQTPQPVPPAAAVIKEITIDGTGGEYPSSGAVYIQNRSKYDIDIASLLKLKDGVRLSGDQAQVLIMHTHGTEAYTPDESSAYAPTDSSRTTDSNYNMLRVGAEIEKVLEANGIKTIHSTVLNDSPAYSGSYSRALNDISAKLKANPSIKVVIDVHRDAMETNSGIRYKTVATINGEQVAQLMLVTGTNGGGLTHPNWKQNLAFQMKLQQRLNTRFPGIMRPMSIRNERFNQHVTRGSMLLEVGTSGNTLNEALASARIFARELSALLKERS